MGEQKHCEEEDILPGTAADWSDSAISSGYKVSLVPSLIHISNTKDLLCYIWHCLEIYQLK